MGTRYIRTEPLLGSVSATTGRFLSIPTAPVTLLTMNSGFQALSIFNIGSGNFLWGASNIAVDSGSLVFVNARIEWNGIEDVWSTYLLAVSVATLISVSEYRV